MSETPVFFEGKNCKPLSSIHDLSKGERSYLKEHGITPDEFDRLDSISQNEWREECQELAYEDVRKIK